MDRRIDKKKGIRTGTTIPILLSSKEKAVKLAKRKRESLTDLTSRLVDREFAKVAKISKKKS